MKMMDEAIAMLLIISEEKYFWINRVSGKNLSGIFYRLSQRAKIQMPSIMWNGL
jgi:hypothetical protein